MISRPALTNALRFLGQDVTVMIDRPLGSRHPTHGFLYLLNYGYIPGTLAPDGEEVDAYLLGLFEPVVTFRGHCLAVIQRTNDADDKVVVAPPGVLYSILRSEWKPEFLSEVETPVSISTAV